MKKSKEQLINNVIGQLEGVKRMMNEKKDCFSVIVQMKAVKSAFENLTVAFVEDNFLECAAGIKNKDKEKIKKLVKELVKK